MFLTFKILWTQPIYLTICFLPMIYYITSSSHIFPYENWKIFAKIHQKPWVLAPTISKTMGAIAPIAPIPTRALLNKLFKKAFK